MHTIIYSADIILIRSERMTLFFCPPFPFISYHIEQCVLRQNWPGQTKDRQQERQDGTLQRHDKMLCAFGDMNRLRGRNEKQVLLFLEKEKIIR